jgi:hypothetical protein
LSSGNECPTCGQRVSTIEEKRAAWIQSLAYIKEPETDPHHARRRYLMFDQVAEQLEAQIASGKETLPEASEWLNYWKFTASPQLLEVCPFVQQS